LNGETCAASVPQVTQYTLRLLLLYSVQPIVTPSEFRFPEGPIACMKVAGLNIVMGGASYLPDHYARRLDDIQTR
jgi:hypothetical protein